jgi:hypothetical protein
MSDGFLSPPEQVALSLLVGSDCSKEKLKAWLQERKEPFSLSDAARCIEIPAAHFGRGIRIQLGRILNKLGCRRIEKRLSTTRFSYLPPEK